MNVCDIKKRVMETLKTVGAQVQYQSYSGKETSYFTFFIVSDSDEAYGNGDPIVGGAHIQLDGWSKSNMDALNDKAKELLKTAGFRYEFGRDLYESETKIYHRVQQFYLLKEE